MQGIVRTDIGFNLLEFGKRGGHVLSKEGQFFARKL
jgi:hypothetical protein